MRQPAHSGMTGVPRWFGNAARRGIRVMIVLAGCAIGAGQGVAAEPSALTVDQLRTPEQAIAAVWDAEQRGYGQVLAAYEDARKAAPDDVTLAVSQCGFIQRFAWSEESTWNDAAAKDLETCKTMLEQQHASDPEAKLFLLGSKFGKAAVTYGEPMLAESSAWTTEQRTRLHTALSHAYAAGHDERRAGEQAVLVLQLDPDSEQLIPAMRYLAKAKRVDEAGQLLASAPVPKLAWQESARIRAAVELLPPAAGRDELQRARDAGLKIDAPTTARALRRAGDTAGAQAALGADTTSRAGETGEARQLRLDVAFDAGATQAVADALGDWVRKSGVSAPLGYAYARLIRMDPMAALRPDLLPLAAWLLFFTAILVLSPAIVLFPAHYRGTVRARLGKPLEPLFARIGLRHAWFAFAVLVAALQLVPIARFGRDVSDWLPTLGASTDLQRQLALSQIWATGLALLGLSWVATRLSWRDWLGSGRWRLTWLIPALCCLAPAILGLLAGRHVLQVDGADAHATLIVALITGMKALGGLPLALLMVAVVVPVCEELVFRGCLLGGLSRHLSFGWANLWQATAFAALHQDPKRALFYLLLGLVAGWLTRKTKGLTAPFLLHAANNAIFVVTWAG
ncbi:CPBP family intramembrane metalloprotease [Ralstonia solanacearum]|uniref:type II CAAX endopeptidase family protein n=2 Tax=Ralstonia solanacearum TaxID=305 RepID=UPI00018168ED|nr:type II CAAX endopeptidase family protein [Ralstonia solanacearum]MDC6209402.1 type II CAAX endopeptidase family protein [Ralstonia solanacearum]MDC6237528.1 type II CAAX endopeptidase family protein [Ralstonia solanacearum]MDD7799808.1 type II CAAX endopeptidase family protein [Ralstonia solanacearum]TYZ55596.1 CPBP family intramembrane metalloprotease [Ralstonia solanacearum]